MKKNKIKVAILKFPHNSLYGGGEKHTISLVERLKSKGFDFVLVSTCKILLEQFKKRGWRARRVWAGIEPVSVKGVLLFPLSCFYVWPRLVFELFRLRFGEGVQVIYSLSLTEKLLLVIPARILGMKVVWVEHLRIEKWLLSNPYKFLYKFNSRFVKVVAVSKSVAQQLLNMGIRKKNIQVIYNGINLNEFKFQNDKKSEKKGRDKIIIGTASRICVEKGIDYLVRAFEIVSKKGLRAELRIAGEGPEKKRLEEIVLQLGLQERVKFVGFIKNIPDFLSDLDIFAMTPVRRESFGIAVAEASASGLPVVVTDISGLREVVKNGDTGYVVERENSEVIAKAFFELISDEKLRRKMGRAGRKRIKTYFSEKRMVSEFELLFRN